MEQNEILGETSEICTSSLKRILGNEDTFFSNNITNMFPNFLRNIDTHLED